ncbi:MAG: type II toxin-antitoxin system PemK/MazF family toxin [Erythrobacter sp.]
MVVCNYETGFKPPEMVKRRLAVVISPKLKNRNELCTVVPLSTSSPDPVEGYHCLIVLPQEPPHPYEGREKWVKADMLATVAYSRLTLPFHKAERNRPRRSVQMRIQGEQFEQIMTCVRRALGI